jgi:hypothetical protein
MLGVVAAKERRESLVTPVGAAVQREQRGHGGLLKDLGVSRLAW